MKKIFALVLALTLVFGAAFAAEIRPLTSVNMEESLDDCQLRVGIKVADVTETNVVAEVYDEMRYDAVEVIEMQVGDTIEYMGEDITVESIDEDYSKFVNGGDVNGGVTLCPDEGGTFIALEYESPAYMLLGCAELTFADEVTYRHWHEAEDGSIADDMIEKVVPAAEVKAALSEDGWDAYYPDQLSVLIEGGKVTEVTVNYVP